MQKKKLISVVVPIYNIERYVGKCIESLLNQTYRNIEIILVNDGSVDNSKAICEKYLKEDSRILLINKENQGLISARKTGVNAAKGEYIAYVDGDDWVKPNMFEKLLNHAVESDADVVAGGHIEIWNEYEELQLNKIPAGIYSDECLKDNIYNFMMYNGNFSQLGIFSYVWGKLYKRDFIIPCQLAVDENIYIGEDAACLYPCLLNAKRIQVVEDANYYYRQRTGSMIKSPNSKEVDKIAIFYNYLKNIFDHSEYRSTLIHQLNYFTLSLLTVRSNFVPQSFLRNNDFYPFKNVNPFERIVLYGAGTFGQILYSRIKTTNGLNLIEWIDDIYEEYIDCGLEVNSPDGLSSLEYDKILIAYIDEKISAQVEYKLLKTGVPENKICKVIHYETEDIRPTLSEYGIDVIK